MRIPTGSSTEIEYPSSDGQPMSENQWQLDAMIDAINVLTTHFADCPGVYVSGDLLIYYEEGNPGARVAPDVFVVVGAPKHLRMNYKLWEEPGPPDFVLEVVASAGTRREAQGPKRALYARLGIREYWFFDPVGGYLAPPLQGFRLHGGDYHPLPARPVGGAPVLRSDALRLELRLENEKLRFHDPARERIFSPTRSSRRSSGISERATPSSNSATGCRPTRLLERFFLEGFFPTMRNWRRSSGT